MGDGGLVYFLDLDERPVGGVGGVGGGGLVVDLVVAFGCYDCEHLVVDVSGYDSFDVGGGFEELAGDDSSAASEIESFDRGLLGDVGEAEHFQAWGAGDELVGCYYFLGWGCHGCCDGLICWYGMGKLLCSVRIAKKCDTYSDMEG